MLPFFARVAALMLLLLVGCEQAQQLLDDAKKQATGEAKAPNMAEAPATATASPEPPAANAAATPMSTEANSTGNAGTNTTPPTNTANASLPTVAPVKKTDEQILAEWKSLRPDQKRGEAVAKLGELSLEGKLKMTSLQLHAFGALEPGFSIVKELKQLKSIEFLDCRLEKSQMETLAMLPNLEQVSAIRCDIGEGIIDPLAQSKLKTLILGVNRLTDAALLPLKSLTTLETLDLSSNFEITGSGLEEAQYLKTLKKLIVKDTKFGLAGFKPLKQALHLEILVADNVQLASEQLKEFGDHAKLRELYLSNNAIDDEGISYLRGHNALEIIDLSKTMINGQTLLPSFRNNKKLRVVKVGMSRIDNNILLKLKASSPNVDFGV
jgi:Leucine Rich repeat